MCVINTNGKFKTAYLISNVIFSKKSRFSLNEICEEVAHIVSVNSPALQDSVGSVLDDFKEKNIVYSNGVTYKLSKEYRLQDS